MYAVQATAERTWKYHPYPCPDYMERCPRMRLEARMLLASQQSALRAEPPRPHPAWFQWTGDTP